jgi:gamma-glutamyltranspeptidase/glutathione hydrolase
VVVADEIMAAKIGAEILAMGGNAVDAAVATGFALAVTHPSAGNVGGGGFMLVYLRETGKTIAVDYRETAPAAATRDMYLDADGNVDNEMILYSYRSAGVPGTVAGLLHVQERYGRLPRRTVMGPAIRLAREGWPLNYYQAARIEASREGLSRDPTARATFFKPGGAGYLPGERFRWPELATTLEMIAEQGRDGFYRGPVADRIADAMAANGGLITREDLAGYEVSVREPVVGEFRGHQIASMPPPSSGGVHLIQMLNMLQTKPPFAGPAESSERLHFIAEIMRRVYADRAEWLGDPDFVDVPTRGLLSTEYAGALAAGIEQDRASSSRDIRAGNPNRYESPQTTHYSVIDSDGNMVANTYTLNRSFGSRIIVPGTGVLLNNEMDDFAAAPGVPNYYGLVGGERNAIVAGKRPLSSMTPTLVFKDGEPFMSLGALGGSRIITAVFNVIVNVIDRQMNIADAIDAPRIHHQWLPDRLSHEPGLAADTIAGLERRGHEVAQLDWFAGLAAALVKDGWVFGIADSRIPGGAACFVDSGC